MPRLRWSLLLLPLWLVAPVRADEPLSYPPADQVRKAFLKLLDRPKVPLGAKVEPDKATAPGARLERSASLRSRRRQPGRGVRRCRT